MIRASASSTERVMNTAESALSVECIIWDSRVLAVKSSPARVTRISTSADENVGGNEGSAEGMIDWAGLGMDDGGDGGSTVGSVDGSAVGSTVGFTVGASVGSVDGIAVGSCVGPVLGAAEGTGVGSMVGRVVG